MPNIRLTDEVAEMSGAWTHDPQRKRKPAPKSSHPLGTAPTYFLKDEKKVWQEIGFYSPAGVLTGNDRMVVETVCMLMAKMRRREEMRGSDFSTLMQGIARLGMTPVDRTRLQASQTEDEADEFAQFRN